MEKCPDGSSVFRGQRAEEKVEQRFERSRQNHLDQVYGKLQAEFEKKALALGGFISRLVQVKKNEILGLESKNILCFLSPQEDH